MKYPLSARPEWSDQVMAGAVRLHRCMFVRDVLSSAQSEARVGHEAQEAQVSVCGVVVELTRPDLEIHANRPLMLSIGQ